MTCWIPRPPVRLPPLTTVKIPPRSVSFHLFVEDRFETRILGSITHDWSLSGRTAKDWSTHSANISGGLIRRIPAGRVYGINMIVQRHVNKTIDPRAFDLLIDESFIRQGDLIKAIQDSLQQGIDLEDLLTRQYRVPKAAIGKALSRFFECPYIPYDERMVVDPQLIKDLSHDYLWKHMWVPLKANDSVLDVLIDDPHDIVRGHDIQRAFPGMTIRYAVALKGDIKRFLQSTIGMTDTGSIEDTLGELVHEARAEESLAGDVDVIDENDSAIVRLANQIIVEAYRQEASDIHIEPYSDRKETAIRLRIDGTCSTYMRIPAAYRRALVSRIKIMSNLDIAERRKPQDGKLRFRLNRGNRSTSRHDADGGK
jgi:hypothetical protein